MSHYVAAYDTEAIYKWWEESKTEGGINGYEAVARYDQQSLKDFLNGVQAVAEVHANSQTPATFFIVAKLLDYVSNELRSILNNPIFDLQCHSYTHPDLVAISDNEAALRRELGDSKKRIEDVFGIEVIGLTAPGGYARGFRGQERILAMMQELGYRYVRSVGAGPRETVPAPLVQPFWYDFDGFSEILEIPSHAWHDNILTGQPGIVHWPPVLPWPYPTKMPTDARGVYDAYAPGIKYSVQHDLLTYTPVFHPWSIYRVSQEAEQIKLLVAHAKEHMEVVSCSELYNKIFIDRSLACGIPPS